MSPQKCLLWRRSTLVFWCSSHSTLFFLPLPAFFVYRTLLRGEVHGSEMRDVLMHRTEGLEVCWQSPRLMEDICRPQIEWRWIIEKTTVAHEWRAWQKRKKTHTSTASSCNKSHGLSPQRTATMLLKEFWKLITCRDWQVGGEKDGPVNSALTACLQFENWSREETATTPHGFFSQQTGWILTDCLFFLHFCFACYPFPKGYWVKCMRKKKLFCHVVALCRIW